MKQCACRRLLSLLLFAALVTTSGLLRAADPATLQRDAIAKIEAVADHLRKTFDYTSRIADLADAERQLRASVEVFDDRGDLANVALSLIWLGQIQHMQGKWDAAGRYYEQAESAASKANHAAHHAKALMGRARTATGLRDYGGAQAHVEQAVRLATSVEDKTYFFNALDILANVQMQQGNFNAAADSLNRAFALPGIKDDLLYYGYLDRSDVYLKLAEKCDYQRHFDVCSQALERMREDLTKALGIAQKLGWAGLAKATEGFLRDADVRAMLIGKQKDSHESFAKAKDDMFDPQKPSDVLVTEGFVAGSESLQHTVKYTITKQGEIFSDFFAIQNGKKISEKLAGTVTLAGGVLLVIRKGSAPTRYVLRGWLETPYVTIMKLNGPWYDDPIPENIFTDPHQGWNLDEHWVRKK